MKRAIVLVFVFALANVLGCASSARPEPLTPADDECATGGAEEQAACLRAKNQELKEETSHYKQEVSNLESAVVADVNSSGDAKAKPGELKAKAAPAGDVMPSGRRVVLDRRMLPAGGNPRNGCGSYGFDFQEANNTGFYCEAQPSRARKPCGDGGTITRWVRMPNGNVRPANLIPSWSIGYDYFEPQLGGSGPQNVTVQCFTASPVDGFDPKTPLMWVGRPFSYPVRMPSQDAISHVDIRPVHIGLR